VANAQVLAVAQQLEEVAGVLAARDNQDVADAGVKQALDGVINHGPVVDRKKVLVGHHGERSQTRS
jgi:hypothetical protein